MDTDLLKGAQNSVIVKTSAFLNLNLHLCIDLFFMCFRLKQTYVTTVLNHLKYSNGIFLVCVYSLQNLRDRK
jgi:hypothetical protein